jgi:hypothetical protein
VKESAPSPSAAADPSPPQVVSGEPYVRLVAGKTLEEGKGFPGVIAIGDPTPSMYKTLGEPREDMAYPFWYFYDKGPWALTVVAEYVADTFRTRAIIISGSGAPATTKGVHIGDPTSAVASAYGKAVPFSGNVASPAFNKLTWVAVKPGVSMGVHKGGGQNPDSDAPFRDSLFYPALGTLFVVHEGKVAQIAVVEP